LQWAIASIQSPEAGVFRSADNGNTWIKTKLNWHRGSLIAVDRSNRVFIAWGNSILRFTEFGDDEVEITHGIISDEVSALVLNSKGHLFAASKLDGVFRSLNGGETWEQINQGLTNTRIYSLAVNSNDDIFAGTNGDGVFRSSDNGIMWQPVNAGFTSSEGVCIAFDKNENILVGAFGDAYRSTDNGNHWERIGPSVGFGVISTIFVNSSNTIFLGTSDYGVFRSTDNGTTWQQVNTGIVNSTINALATGPDNSIFAGTNGGLFISNDGQDWKKINFPKTQINGIDVYDPFVEDIVSNPSTASIFVATVVSGLYRTNNSGGSWILVNPKFADLLAINSDFQVFASGDGLYRTDDNGNGWNKIDNGLGSADVSAIGIGNNNDVFVATNNGLFFSGDDGNLWQQAGSVGKNATGLVINKTGDLFAGFLGEGIYYSSNNGKTWEQRNEGLSNLSLNITSLLLDSHGVLYAGTLAGAFLSGNNGKSWSPVHPDMSHTRIFSLTLDDEDNLFVGTDGNGVFRGKVSRSQ
jgi:photosystem II stability/assembly factor-like uncharacterized protein